MFPGGRRSVPSVFLCLLLLFAALVPVSAEGGGNSPAGFIHRPVAAPDPQSPTGLKTTWSCVFFGAYPSAEVVDGKWNSVDDYALREGDLIRDDALYARLETADWQGDSVEMDGYRYLRVGLDKAHAESTNTEQHYIWDYSRPWHYFRIQPIRWRVLDIQENRAMLLADRMPDSVPFHAADEEIAWDGSTLRSWLNGYDAKANKQGIDYTGAGFIDRAFTAEEREAILPVQCENDANRDYQTDSGKDTEDCLFILSNDEVFEETEAERYGFHFGRDYDDPAKRFTSTLYAKCMGAWWSPVDAYAGNSFWFMRTSGYTPRSVTYVCDFGYIYSRGTLVTCSDAGVLPAMWIDLDKAEVTDGGERVSSEIIHTPADEESVLFPIPDIGNPVTVQDDSVPDGVYTVWNAVTFGHYPQTEILEESPDSGSGEPEGDSVVNPGLYRRLEAEAGDHGEEAVLEGTKYIRLDGRWFRCDPILWRVLEVSDGTALLMADSCLDSVPYHDMYSDVFWEDSGLRAWLNGTRDEYAPEYGASAFPETAFTETEFRAVMVSDVNNASNWYFGTPCGSGTHDRVFILSEEEVFCSVKAEKYGFRTSDAIADFGRRIAPTAYAKARGAWCSADSETAGLGFWLLRTNGYTRDNVVYAGEKGYLYNRGIPVTCSDAGIVPVIRVRLGASPMEQAEDIIRTEWQK